MISQEVPFVIHLAGDKSLIARPDCDCACPSPTLSNALSNLIQKDLPAVQVKLDSSVYFTELNQDYQMAFSLSAPRAPVLMNAAARRLIQMLESPRPIAAVAEAYTHTDITPTIMTLINSGLLRTSPSKSADCCHDEPDVLVVWLHMTNACNLNCTYCYLSKTDDMMSSETAHAAISAVFRTAIAHASRAVKIKYSGGEPTLNFPLILQLHDRARILAEQHKLGLDEVILSNGVSWTSDMMEATDKRGIRIMISLDGTGREHDSQRPCANGQGTLASVMLTIHRLLEYGIIPHISVTITAQNTTELPDLVTWLLKHHLPFSLNFRRGNRRFAPNGSLPSDERRMIAAMRAVFRIIEAELPADGLCGSLLDRASLVAPHRYPCAVGRNYLVIDHRGRIAKCQMRMADTVTTISAANPLDLVRADRAGIENVPVDDKEGCRECEWRYWCAGGCPLEAYESTRRYDVKSPNCSVYRVLFPDLLRLEGLRLLKCATRNAACSHRPERNHS
jgi:uncharacterized protein